MAAGKRVWMFAVTLIAISCTNHSTWVWSALEDPGPLGPREGVALAVTPTVTFAWGGIDVDGTVHDDGALLEGGRWTSAASGPLSPRHSAGVAVLDGSRVAVVGGSSAPNLNGPGDLRDGAVYDPTTRRWEPLAPLPERVSLNRVCRTLVAVGERLVTPCVADGEPWAELVEGQWIQLVPPRDLDRTTVQLAAVNDLLVAVWVAGGQLRSARETATGWVATTGGEVREVATPFGRIAPLTVATVGDRVAALTTERVWWFDGDRRWTPGLRIPPEPNTAVGNTAVAVDVDGVLVRLDLGRDLALEDAEWRLVPRPAGEPAPWVRQLPSCGPTACLVVAEPPDAQPLSGRHTVWELSRG